MQPFARSPRRWAPSSSAPRSPPTSRSGGTARPRSSTRRAHARPGRAHPRPPRRHARCGRRRARARPRLRATSAILNDPFAGGTHLPDITLVSRTRVGFAVTRAHHADVGGIEPGSLPAESRRSRTRASSYRRPASTTPRSSGSSPDAEPRRAPRRSPRPARGARAGGAAARRAVRAPGRSASRRPWTSCTTTRSGSCAPRSCSFPTVASRRSTCSSPPAAASSGSASR